MYAVCMCSYIFLSPLITHYSLIIVTSYLTLTAIVLLFVSLSCLLSSSCQVLLSLILSYCHTLSSFLITTVIVTSVRYGISLNISLRISLRISLHISLHTFPLISLSISLHISIHISLHISPRISTSYSLFLITCLYSCYIHISCLSSTLITRSVLSRPISLHIITSCHHFLTSRSIPLHFMSSLLSYSCSSSYLVFSPHLVKSCYLSSCLIGTPCHHF